MCYIDETCGSSVFDYFELIEFTFIIKIAGRTSTFKLKSDQWCTHICFFLHGERTYMNVSEFKCFIGVFVQILFTIIFHFKFYFIVGTISFMIRVGDWLWRVYLFKSDFYFEWNTGRYIVWEHIGFQYPSYFVSLTIFF